MPSMLSLSFSREMRCLPRCATLRCGYSQRKKWSCSGELDHGPEPWRSIFLILVKGQLMYPIVSSHCSTYFTAIFLFHLFMGVNKHGVRHVKITWKFYPLKLRIRVTMFYHLTASTCLSKPTFAFQLFVTVLTGCNTTASVWLQQWGASPCFHFLLSQGSPQLLFSPFCRVSWPLSSLSPQSRPQPSFVPQSTQTTPTNSLRTFSRKCSAKKTPGSPPSQESPRAQHIS